MGSWPCSSCCLIHLGTRVHNGCTICINRFSASGIRVTGAYCSAPALFLALGGAVLRHVDCSRGGICEEAGIGGAVLFYRYVARLQCGQQLLLHVFQVLRRMAAGEQNGGIIGSSVLVTNEAWFLDSCKKNKK